MFRPMIAGRTSVLAGFCLAASFFATPGIAQDSPPLAKPLPEHKILATEEGAWDATIKTYMGGPDSAPALSRAPRSTRSCPGACGCSQSSRASSAG